MPKQDFVVWKTIISPHLNKKIRNKLTIKISFVLLI